MQGRDRQLLQAIHDVTVDTLYVALATIYLLLYNDGNADINQSAHVTVVSTGCSKICIHMHKSQTTTNAPYAEKLGLS